MPRKSRYSYVALIRRLIALGFQLRSHQRHLGQLDRLLDIPPHQASQSVREERIVELGRLPAELAALRGQHNALLAAVLDLHPLTGKSLTARILNEAQQKTHQALGRAIWLDDSPK